MFGTFKVLEQDDLRGGGVEPRFLLAPALVAGLGQALLGLGAAGEQRGAQLGAAEVFQGYSQMAALRDAAVAACQR